MEDSRPIKKRVSNGGEFSMLSEGKVPPNAADLEEAVLGAIMLEDHCVSLVTAKLIPEHFYKIEHQYIFKAIQELAEKDSPIDILTVTQKCKEHGTLESVGGAYFISQLTDRVASSSNVEYHSEIIRQKALAREQIKFFGEGYEMAFDPTVDPIDTNDYISMGAERLATSVSFTKRYTNTELINQVITNAEMARENGGIIGIPTGIHERDRITKGLQGGKLYIKAARPSMGKLQPLTEPILTPDGWVKMGDVKVGTYVSCPVSGLPTKVIKTHPQEGLNIYRITFGDGSYTECCDEHLWKIQTQTDIQKGRSRVVQLKWMIENGVLDTRNKSRYRIPLTNPVEFTEKECSMHPYLIGLLIADGYLPENNQVAITCHSDIAEQRFEVVKSICPKGVNVKLDRQYGKVKARRIVFSKEIKPYLKLEGLLGKKSRSKFVPYNYLYNSVAKRKTLLSALLDCDGSCFIAADKRTKQVSYATMSKELKDNVVELVKSLGGTASVSQEEREKYKGGKCFIISIRTPFNPFTEQSKRESFDHNDYTVSFSKHIRKIEYLRKDKGQCITVDSPHSLYITRDYTVTHNSADALCEAIHIAVNLKKPVAFFSLEMGGMELMQRAMSSLSEIDLTKIIEGNLTKEEWGIINEQARVITDSPLVIIDNSMSLTEIKAEARMLKETKGIEAVFIDYLQLIEHKTSGGGTRENVVSEISRSLKLMAKKLDVPVVALSQLSRSVETRGGEKIPMLSDLRESGAIEQDADLVEFLYRPEYYGKEEFNGMSSQGMAVSIIAKNRGGSLANIEMRFIKHLTKFTRYVEEILPSTPRPLKEPDMDNYRSPMPKSQEFGDIDELKDEEDEVF